MDERKKSFYEIGRIMREKIGYDDFSIVVNGHSQGEFRKVADISYDMEFFSVAEYEGDEIVSAWEFVDGEGDGTGYRRLQ